MGREAAARHTIAAAGRSTVAPSPSPSWSGRPSRLPYEPDHVQTAELLSRVSIGDTDAFAVACEALSPAVWALVQAVVRDRDLAQATAWQAFEEMRHTVSNCPPDSGAATAWAMGIVLRRAARTAAESAERQEPPEDPGVPVSGSRTGQSEHIRRALLALPDRQRDTVLLTCYGRLTIGQVAHVLDAPPQETAVLLRDGLARLRDLLAVRAHGH
jgi:DNA-directed RNA polymerase specialized sigma24 family protein